MTWQEQLSTMKDFNAPCYCEHTDCEDGGKKPLSPVDAYYCEYCAFILCKKHYGDIEESTCANCREIDNLLHPHPIKK